jgi:hypothetical protein
MKQSPKEADNGKPGTVLYPEPDESSPHPHTPISTKLISLLSFHLYVALQHSFNSLHGLKTGFQNDHF